MNPTCAIVGCEKPAGAHRRICWMHRKRAQRGATLPALRIEPPTPREALYASAIQFGLASLVGGDALHLARRRFLYALRDFFEHHRRTE